MKMKAIFAAAVLAVSAMPTISAKAAPSAEMYTWIPTTFEAARDFCLVEHGATYIDGRTVCAVFREYDGENRDYSISVDGNSKPTEIYHETFNTPAGYTGELYKYEVVVYYAENGGQFDISLHSGTKTLNKYSFQSQFTMDSAKIAETDYFSWVPDCYSEYTTFIETNGNTLVKDKYICFCDDVNYSTGADISMEQSGTAEIKEVQQFNVSKSDEAVAGNTAHTVRLYEAVTPGTVDVAIYKGRTWDPNAPKEEMLSGSYEVSESMTITPIEKTDFIKGDVNADGNFTVADVVMLQKWLLCVPDVTLANWKAADLCEDGVLNVFDLCMMKKELLRKADVKTEIEFISTDKLRDYGLDHEEWKGFIAFSNNDFEAIIKNNEGEYTQSILPEDVFNENAVLVVYSQIGASNKYSIIDDISISDNTIVVSSTTKEPTIATPDMSYRRYIYIVDKNAVSKECVFSFDDSSSYYNYEEGSEVANWFKEWENRNK